MSLKLSSTAIAKLILFAMILAFFSYGMYWLWQRQPANDNNQDISILEASESDSITGLSISPKNFSIVREESVEFEGVTTPNAYVALFSNTDAGLVKSDENGNFATELTFTEGLNLVQLMIITNNLTEETTHTLVYYLATEEEELEDNTVVFAGPIKSIFDSLVTVTTTEGERKIQINASTLLDIPQGEDEELEATQSALINVRVGDYAVALGKIKEDFLDTQGLLVIREGKPKIEKLIITGVILTSVNDNLFSIRNEGSEIIEFALTQSSQILSEAGEITSSDIEKDKNVIVIYSQQDDELVTSLIYVLP